MRTSFFLAQGFFIPARLRFLVDYDRVSGGALMPWRASVHVRMPSRWGKWASLVLEAGGGIQGSGSPQTKYFCGVCLNKTAHSSRLRENTDIKEALAQTG